MGGGELLTWIWGIKTGPGGFTPSGLAQTPRSREDGSSFGLIGVLRRNSTSITGLVAIGVVLGPIDRAMATNVHAPAGSGPAPRVGGKASTGVSSTPVKRSPSSDSRLPKSRSSVQSVSSIARSTPQRIPDTGLDLLVSGVALAGLVGPSLIIAGSIDYTRHQDPRFYSYLLYRPIDIAMISFGITAIGTGVPLMTLGAIRFTGYRRWMQTRTTRLIPGLGRTALGTRTVTLQIRF